MKTKPFDEEVFNRCDKPGIGALQKYFAGKGYDVQPYPEGEYGVDLLCMKMFMVDAEVREGWAEGPFPFETIHVPGRKEKFIRPGTWFFSIRKDLKVAMAVNSLLCTSERLVIVDNKYLQEECFYDIPADLAMRLEL